MLRKSFHCIHACLLVLIVSSRCAVAGVIEFWNDPVGWQKEVGDYKFTDFTEFQHGTIMTTQITGLTFATFVFIHNAQGYTDGFGLSGNNGIHIMFDTPHHAIAVDHLGVFTAALYFQGELVMIAPTYCNTNCPFPGFFSYADPGVAFSGIVSVAPFDEVYLFKSVPPFTNNVISVDNLYWGMPVPAPGILGFLILAGFAARRRRRT